MSDLLGHDLTGRYVAATLHHVPAARREEVRARLMADLTRAHAQAAAAGTPAPQVERAALLALGDPERRAAQYAGRDLVLIGPRLYLHWWRTLRIVLAVAPTVMAVLVLIAGVTAQEAVLPLLGDAISTFWNVAVNVAFWVTLVFALLERFSPAVEFGEDWVPEQLPEAQPERSVSLADAAVSTAFLAVAVAFFPWQEWMAPTIGGVETPLLDSELWSFWLPYLMVILALEIVLEVVRYRVGRPTLRLVAVKAVLVTAFTIPAVALLATGRMAHPELARALDTTPEVIDRGASFVALAIGLIAVADLAGAARELWRSAEQRSLEGAA